MAKEAQGFAEQEKTFEVQGGKANAPGEGKIILNISDLEEEKSLLQKGSISQLKFTGNPIVDSYRRINAFFIANATIKIQDLANFFRLLATMINAGVPLIKSLNSLADQTKKSPKLKMIIEDVSQKIEEGESLAEALRVHKDVFSEAQTGMVAAGEASGQLNEVLLDLATEVEKSASIKRKVKGAATYPVVVMTLLAGVMTVMMIKVVPKLTELFTQSDAELPILTRGLISLSDFLVKRWTLLGLGLLLASGLLILWKKTKQGHYTLDNIKLKVPIFGTLIQKSILARFSRLFSNLLESGLPLVDSLKIVAQAIGNDVYKERIYLATEDIKQGIPLAENLVGSPLFPDMLVNMIEVGEKTASLEQVLEKIAIFYEEEVDVAIKGMTKIFEPIILVVVGLVVGLLVAAIMLPIIQLTEIGTGG